MSFANSGLITASKKNDFGSSLYATETLSLSNTGTIDNGLVAIANFGNKDGLGSLTATNAGTIRTAFSGAALDLSVISETSGTGGSV